MSRDNMRCYVERDGNGWKSYCVDVDLSAPGNTPDQARRALERELEHYCHERDDGSTVRRAPLRRQLAWWLAWLRGGAGPDGLCYVFRVPPQMLTGLA